MTPEEMTLEINDLKWPQFVFSPKLAHGDTVIHHAINVTAWYHQFDFSSPGGVMGVTFVQTSD